MKVLITAFEPFNKEIINYSYEVMKLINTDTKVLLNVVYDECYKQLKKICNLEKYDLIVAMGEARNRVELTLETLAKNIKSAKIPDNNGNIFECEKVIYDGIDVLKTKVEYSKVKDYISFSNDAGTFVCNNLYYHLLNDFPQKSLFIHIPNCYESKEEYIKHSKTISKIIEILTKI